MTTLLHPTAPDMTDGADVAEPAIEDAIQRHGFATRHVTGDATRPSWAHTIGLDRSGQPELVVVGVTADAAEAVLHWFVDLLRGGVQLVPGRPYSFGGVPVRVVPVPEQCWGEGNDLLAVGGRPAAGALQIVWADRHGRFPWEIDFDADLAWLQPVLEHRWMRWQTD